MVNLSYADRNSVVEQGDHSSGSHSGNDFFPGLFRDISDRVLVITGRKNAHPFVPVRTTERVSNELDNEILSGTSALTFHRRCPGWPLGLALRPYQKKPQTPKKQ